MKRKLLIFAKNIKIVESLESFLKNSNFDIKFAENKDSAYLMLTEFIPDLIMIDEDFDDLNGFMFCNLLKQNIKYADIPIIFLLTNKVHIEKVQEFEFGTVDYISKPLIMLEVSYRINSILHNNNTCHKLKLENRNLNKKIDNLVNIAHFSKEQYNRLFNEIPLGIYRADKNGIIIIANKKYYQILGYLNDNESNNVQLNCQVNHNISQFVHLDFSSTNIHHKLDRKIANKKNELIDVIEVVSVIKDEFGVIQFYDGIIQDNSKFKELETLNRKLIAGIEQSGSNIIITDRKGKIEYVNKTFIKTTGYTLEEATGKNPNILNSGHHNKEFYSELWKTIKSGQNWRGVFLNKKKDGSFYWESALISPIKDKDNKITNFIAIKDDITVQKKLEDELLSAKKVAEEANNFKDVIIQNFSHEIRTPMNVILNTTQLLLSTLTKSENIDLLKYQYEAGQRLLKTLDTIMKVSKLESNSIQLEKIDIDFTASLEFLFRQFKSKLAEKKLTIKDVSVQKNQIIEIDEGLLLEILYQIIDNAIKFSENSEIIVDYLVENEYLIITIKDSGVGIESDKFDVIFEAFRQGSEGSARNYEGLGLGLTLVYKLTKLLKGEVEIKSKKGIGTSVILKIPISN